MKHARRHRRWWWRSLCRCLLLHTGTWPWRWLWQPLLRRTLLASLPPRCGWPSAHRSYGPMPIFVGGGGDDHADHDHEPFGGVRGSWAAHDLHLQVATELAAAALQKLTQLLHVEVGLPEQGVLGLHRDWPGLCLLAHKRTGKRMMTLQTNHSKR